MKKIISQQGTGKTKEIIEIAYNENATIVCETPERMMVKIHGYGYVGIPCISFEEYVAGRTENAGVKYVVDDIEALLYFISKNTIAFTVSNS